MTHRRLLSFAGMLLSTVMLGSCGDPVGLLPPGLAILSGDKQSGVAGQPLPEPLLVTVADGTGRGVEGAQIYWEVTTGAGTIPFITYTDAKGEAAATWVLGGTVGVQTATAAVTGLNGSPRTFTATADRAANTLTWASEQLPPCYGPGAGIWASSPADVFAVCGRGMIWH